MPLHFQYSRFACQGIIRRISVVELDAKLSVWTVLHRVFELFVRFAELPHNEAPVFSVKIEQLFYMVMAPIEIPPRIADAEYRDAKKCRRNQKE